ncbi:hypothetical protein [Saccharothrix violaceirubra]|uniref:Uncharacterized protein n=1 Tax=Saccharothrix violaceirubra TaxID=413306 RepID=A0A7W7WVF3_9PSEU|nr:hypothetical protein [Saccharothrix violaceirubra]MBB4964996.1 hypothetical protein [Saccharothrix violaceirubra]
MLYHLAVAGGRHRGIEIHCSASWLVKTKSETVIRDDFVRAVVPMVDNSGVEMKILLGLLSRMVAILAAMAFMLSIPVAAANAAGGDFVAQDASAVLDRLSATGRLTAGDRDILLKYPRLAAQVEDPDQATSGGSVRFDAERAKLVGAQGCWISDWYHHAKTALGNTFYKFHHRADWCQDGNRVLGVHYRSHHFSEVSAFAYPRHVESDYVTPTPSWEVKSRKSHLVDNCIPLKGCLWASHPWVEHTMRGNAENWSADGEQ